MATLKWFEELLSKTNGSEFDNKKTSDSFEVIVHEGHIDIVDVFAF